MQPDGSRPGGISDSVISGDVHHHHYSKQPAAQPQPAPQPAAAAPQVIVVQQQQQQMMAPAGPTVIHSGNQKSTGVAYLLWCLGIIGLPGIHRIYLGDSGGGAGQLALAIIGWITLIIFIGCALLAVAYIWWFIDLFTIPSLASKNNNVIVYR